MNARGKRSTCVRATVLTLTALFGTYLAGWYLDAEYMHWPTIWKASQSETSAGVRVSELVRARTGKPGAKPRWHHCGWCEMAYAHAKHVAIKVTVDPNEAFLFDWNARTRHLLPLTVRTAERFPELIPSGFIVRPLSEGGLDGQFHADRACEVVPRT
jgi:hypothetical protein